MIKLNIGCGPTNFGKDWIHIDGAKYPHIKYHNITKLPFKNNSVDLIYSSHTLEYFDRVEVIPVLKEWKRVLKKGGLLRLSVPDWVKLYLIYSHYGGRLKNIIGPLFGRMKLGNKYIYHKTVYDYGDLKDLLEKVGFNDVVEYNWLSTSHFMIDDASRAHWPHRPENYKTGVFDKDQFPISLNIEANK